MTPEAIIVQQANQYLTHPIEGEKITNDVFLVIESVPRVNDLYQFAIRGNRVGNVHQKIGRAVKKFYGLENLKKDNGKDDREQNPSSTLIKSHQKFLNNHQ